jgi:malic enzyme
MFPVSFLGVLDVRVPTSNNEMKRVTVYTIRKLAKKNVPKSIYR